MRKKLVLMLIMTILISTIVPSYIYAEGDTDEDIDTADKVAKDISGGTTFEEILQHQAETGKDVADSVFTEGQAPLRPKDGNSRFEIVREQHTAGDLNATVVCSILGLPAEAVTFMMKLLVSLDQGEFVDNFTIQDVVFNKYEIFNINFFQYDDTKSTANVALRKSVAEWYYAMRGLAIVGSLMVLIYIGIRMAISTLASDKAKYKKMFVNWIISFALIFVMHYIVIILLAVQDWLLDIISGFVQEEGFEEVITNDTWTAFWNTKGWGRASVLIQLYILVYNQVKFFLLYFKRFLTAAFLFIISPLVTLTYSIDAAGDGKAQAYSAWLKIITYNIFIQVIHAAIYAIFIISAGEIAKQVPIAGALLLIALSRIEKIVKATFKLNGRGIADESFREKLKGWGSSHK